VIDGPGIDDNGSGVAGLLEIARALSGTRPQAAVRLAFWSGKELGLHGSMRYVEADACYRQPCDDLANVDLSLARVLTAGLADFTVQVANNHELLADRGHEGLVP
jgi:hypothetical protein